MEVDRTPFPEFWYGIDLPGYREIKGTYQLMAYDTLPPLPLGIFRSEFHWLPAEPWNAEQGCGATEERERAWQEKFERLVRDASEMNLALPASFLRYMRGDLKNVCLSAVAATTGYRIGSWRVPREGATFSCSLPTRRTACSGTCTSIRRAGITAWSCPGTILAAM